MSVITTSPLKVTPAAAIATATTPGTTWTPSPWVQVLASAPAGFAIAGYLLTASGGTQELEIQIGVGGAGSEVVVHKWRHGTHSFAGNAPGAMFPVPVSGITTGQRVAFRTIASRTSQTTGLKLYSYDGFTGETFSAMSCVPTGGIGVNLTPSPMAWNNSAWVTLASGLASEIAIAGINRVIGAGSGVDGATMVYDLAVGPTGSEQVIATLRSTVMATANVYGLDSTLFLPRPHPVAQGRRIAIRLRKNTTLMVNQQMSLLYYGTAGLIPTSQGTKSWIAVS